MDTEAYYAWDAKHEQEQKLRSQQAELEEDLSDRQEGLGSYLFAEDHRDLDNNDGQRTVDSLEFLMQRSARSRSPRRRRKNVE